jgi:coenzyme F420-reducing hydrogenase delta subunit/NAD-dependent dihydropyrimidine dehydrogenase PreA subunit
MYEPKIIAFLCTWCSYTGADSAGIARLKSPANIRAIRVPCSGRVSPEIIMRTFDEGADGVLVLGCHIGECHYETGNHRTAKRLPVVQALMAFVGLEPQRLRLDWVSASEGERFARITSEFVEAVRALGPVKWRVASSERRTIREKLLSCEEPVEYTAMDCSEKTRAIQAKVAELLATGQVGCAIGYEVGPRGRTRPSFAYQPEQVESLVWNPGCTHNLTTYLRDKLRPVKGKEPPRPVAVVVKPCDSRAINVLVAENAFPREQVHAIGVVCEGIRGEDGNLQTRCVNCDERVPCVYDSLIGDPSTVVARSASPVVPGITRLNESTPAERMEFWLSQFDRCIRCYACRQVCPMCDCPTCLYERDDSTWVGMGIGVNEKRTFHLGRAYHLAGRCVGCNECERVCPVDIPISYLNQRLAGEIEKNFAFRAGLAPVVSPIVTVLAGEYKEG